MPNYCINTLEIHGEKKHLEKILEEITVIDKYNNRKLNFEKILKPPYYVFQHPFTTYKDIAKKALAFRLVMNSRFIVNKF